MSNVTSILNQTLTKINPSKEEVAEISNYLNDFLKKLQAQLKKDKIKANAFVGGSFAKKTIIKKGRYDIDVFVRFDEEFRGKDISSLMEKTLKKIVGKELIKVHGSRDYFRINASTFFFIELIPVIEIKNPKYAENITDLSYFHVGYVHKKFKTEKLLQEVRLAKAFCHAKKCYGAESYINGFSGYALELLVYHYGSFLKMLKRIVKIKDKEVIDLEKQYKNKNEVMMNMNSAKLASPIILIDPTYKERNALAALSNETFIEFQKECKKFLENPSIKDFETAKMDLEKLEETAKKSKKDFVSLKIETQKQEGDIAGSKLLKFYRHLSREIEKYYKVYKKDFEYDGKKQANIFFIAEPIKEITLAGPNKNDKKNVDAFKKRHKQIIVKGDRLYAKEKFDSKLKDFLKEWKSVNYQKALEMGISDIKLN